MWQVAITARFETGGNYKVAIQQRMPWRSETAGATSLTVARLPSAVQKNARTASGLEDGGRQRGGTRIIKFPPATKA